MFLLKKIVSILLGFGIFAMLFLPDEWMDIHKREFHSWFNVFLSVGIVVFVFNIMTSFLKPLRKPRGLKITDQYVKVSGVKIARRDIRAWRVFRASHNGERYRYIELELKRVPLSTIEWNLLKSSEQVPPSNRCDRGIPLGSEPRIVATLGSYDLTKDEIDRAMGAVSNEP